MRLTRHILGAGHRSWGCYQFPLVLQWDLEAETHPAMKKAGEVPALGWNAELSSVPAKEFHPEKWEMGGWT
jgi:hypothetical protein